MYYGHDFTIRAASPCEQYSAADTLRLHLTVHIDEETDDDGNKGNKNPNVKAPVCPPQIEISQKTLFLYSGCDNTTLELYAEDETLVYSTYVPEGTEQITLPSDLTGMFELRIIRGSITFVAEIEL